MWPSSPFANCDVNSVAYDTSSLTQIRYTGRHDTQIKKLIFGTQDNACGSINCITPAVLTASDLNFYNKYILILIRYSHTLHIRFTHNLKACLILKFLNT
jgi:hypothetical protein